MKNLVHLFNKYKVWLLAVLKPLGFWGVGCIAMIDAAAIPVPMDLILAGYIWTNKPLAWLYVLMAAAGSAIGGLLPFFLGRAGGEIFLMKRIDRARYEQLRDRFEKQEFLALMIPSILPPPTPWKLFVFAAGVFEMKLMPFLLAVFSGRVIRNTILAVLTVRYGPEIVNVGGRLATQHGVALLVGITLLLALLGWWAWRAVGKRRSPVPV